MNLDKLHPLARYVVVAVALGLLIYEALRPGDPRFWLLVTYTGMLGITSLVGLDKVAGRITGGESPPPSPLPPPPPSPSASPAPSTPSVPSAPTAGAPASESGA